jgi:hypothetical protein
VITEDDPQQGGDHVDYHRTVLVMASPWVKRGYVSKTHIDVASLHKLFAHILGLPTRACLSRRRACRWTSSASTPDYTPFVYEKRAIPAKCGDMATAAEQRITASWDFEDLDRQPGLGAQIDRYLHGRQLRDLPPALEAEVRRREMQRVRGGEDE